MTEAAETDGRQGRLPYLEMPDEERLSLGALSRREEYDALLGRLSHQSVVKHFDAYADIDWDGPEFQIDHDDPRWELPADDVLGRTVWYRSQPPGVRSRIGLHMAATFMKVGAQFESVLKRGLLEFAAGLPNRSPEFRYCYHEVIEEAQHSLMFQEFVNRTGFDIQGLTGLDKLRSRRVIRLGRSCPELFFVFVLAGEDPIDQVQRGLLRYGREQVHPVPTTDAAATPGPRTDWNGVHPLLRRIMQIHVTEEARHLSFARHYLRRHVPEMGSAAQARLAFRVPFVLRIITPLMTQASPETIRRYSIPPEVVDEAYRQSPVHRQRTLEAAKKLRELCVELGIVNRWSLLLWKRLGIWPTGLVVAGG